jgi:hypothetical protein
MVFPRMPRRLPGLPALQGRPAIIFGWLMVWVLANCTF